MIRDLRAYDVFRMLVDNRKTGPDLACTSDKLGYSASGILDQLSSAINLITRKQNSRSKICIDGHGIKGIVSARKRASSKVWEIHLLKLCADLEHWALEFLEGLSLVASKEGADKILLRLPVGNRVEEIAKQAGFIQCETETLYWREALLSQIQRESPYIRIMDKSDYYPVYRLYNEVVPQKVKAIYASTLDEWGDAAEVYGNGIWQGVYGSQDFVRGWIQVGSNRHAANVLNLMVHPEEEVSVSEALMSWGMQQSNFRHPFLCLVPYYQTSLSWILEKRGFIPIGEYCLWVKPTKARVMNSEMAPVGA